MFDSVIIGAGVAGCVAARDLAESGRKVLVLEQRDHIGGNCYDEKDEHANLPNNCFIAVSSYQNKVICKELWSLAQP